MQQGDFSSSYYPYPHQQPPHLQNPNTNPNYLPDHNPNPIPTTYASAPPFTTTTTTNYSSSDYPIYPPSFPQIPDPVVVNPNSHPFNPSPQQPSPSLYEPPHHGSYQSQPQQQQSYYPPFDQHQAAQNYPPPPPSSSIPSNPNPNSSYSASYSSPYSAVGASVPSVYETPFDNYAKYDQGGGGGGYFDENSSRYGGGYDRTRSDLGSDFYGKQRSDSGGVQGYGLGRDDGVRPYEGNKVEPYGARGTAPKSSTWGATFDDYGRSISLPSGKDSSSGSGSSKIVRAVPKAETQQDVTSGVQKFRVKLLAESSGQSTMDVLCQIGLDGIRMLDPNTSRSLRIYPLDTITRCEVAGSSTFAFWSKSSVDIEPKRIRLQSSSYTTNTILDTVTAATVQLKEMGGRSRPSDVPKAAEQSTEKKKGFTDWVTMIKPANEEKDHWVPDEAVSKCTACGTDFGAFVRRHHCRNCGDIFCDKCTHGRIALTADENAQPVRVCDRCLAEVTHRLSNAKEAANRPVLQSHEDLARKLQEEMERNRKSTSGTKSDGSGRRMREVACPICTVHLQVQVPSSGSETIECGVCQHPFLVSAH